MRRYLLFLLVCVCALTGALAARADEGELPAPAPAPLPQPVTPPSDATERQLQKAIARYRRVVWHWQRVMGRPLTRRLDSPPPRLADRVPVWERAAKRTWTNAKHPPHERAWRCIQRFEASWSDPRPPFYGGLQMDLGFQRTYGAYLLRRKGTADRWRPLEQMWVAERAYRSGRGFYPWPNTARYCGLI